MSDGSIEQGHRPADGNARWYEVFAAVSVLALASFLMLRWGVEGIVHNRKVQNVPDLKGRSLSAAMDLLAPLNLAIKKDGKEFNSSVPVEAIVRQNPAAGTKVREGKIVRVVISEGGDTAFVPAVIGLPLRNAEMLLRQKQLILGDITNSYSLRMERGMVLGQNPRPESSVERNSAVSVILSGGPPPAGVVLMPDFQRKDISEAMSWSSQNGIPLETVKDPVSLFAAGTILAQDPTPDTVVSPSSKIRLSVSGRSEKSGKNSMRNIHFEVPQGASDSHVRIVLIDQYGEREVFNGLRSPGSKVDADVPTAESGQARVRIFLNGILVEERDL
ncbi:MAG: PASTA domain-containing protein [Elusimicrobia bacterium]|nr:PASTA domain-containing protein [Elusimicrobiota bacterium]